MSLEDQAFLDKTAAGNQMGCSFENLVFEDTGEFAARRPYSGSNATQVYNWHVTQCMGRDPEPLRCHGDVYARGLVAIFDIFCETEGGEEEYRRLTGL